MNPTIRLEQGTSYAGERSHTTYQHPRHGFCLRTTSELPAGKPVYRVIDRVIRPDGCIRESSVAFRQRQHAEAWQHAITKES